MHTFPIEIKPLANDTGCLAVLAQIWCDVLGDKWLPNISKEEICSDFSQHAEDSKLPLTFVAYYQGEPVGMCSLYDNDGIRPDLTPWLGDLVVSAEHQSKGIGKKLVQTVVNEARCRGFGKLHLFTFEQKVAEYYKKQGWSEIATDEYCGQPVIVMNLKSLTSDS